MTLLEPNQPEAVKRLGLRLIPIVIPDDGDVAPLAALLADPSLREPAREALEEAATGPSKTALRERLSSADPAFASALLDSLGRLRDRDSLATIATLTTNANSKVRASAARALAWTGEPAHIEAIQSVVKAADDATRAEARDARLRLLDAMAHHDAHRKTAVADLPGHPRRDDWS